MKKENRASSAHQNKLAQSSANAPPHAEPLSTDGLDECAYWHEHVLSSLDAISLRLDEAVSSREFRHNAQHHSMPTPFAEPPA